jgi:Eukaryotic aspartyl protease
VLRISHFWKSQVFRGGIFDDGILGLAPEKDANQSSYITYLKNQGIIDKKIFAFYLALDRTSKITFGGYPQELIKQGEEIKWTPIASDFSEHRYW